MAQADETQSNEVTPEAQGRVSAQELLAKQNPALARLATAIETQGQSSSKTDYSRMHHRHNRA